MCVHEGRFLKILIIWKNIFLEHKVKHIGFMIIQFIFNIMHKLLFSKKYIERQQGANE